MAKKSKGSGKHSSQQQPDFERSSGKLGPITTWEDLADSEDEFHINHDKILLQEGPDERRRRKLEEEDAFLEPSDEEVLGYSSEDSDDAEETFYNAKADIQSDDDNAEEQQDEEDEDEGGWGISKKDYYNNDEVITQEDAKAEVEEAIRLQKKRLAKIKPADFGLDELEWLDEGKDGSVKKDGILKPSQVVGDSHKSVVVRETLQPWVPTSEMGADDLARVLQTWYPEFDHLANELSELAPLLQAMEREIGSMQSESAEPNTVKEIKCRALAAYTATLAMYFSVLASPAEKGEGRAMDPEEIHTHEVMDYLVQTREAWLKVKYLKERKQFSIEPAENTLNTPEKSKKRPLEEDDTTRPTKKARNGEEPTPKLSKKAQKEMAFATAAAEKRALQQLQTEASLASLSELLPTSKSRSKSMKTFQPKITQDDDDNSDFGEECHLTTASAAEKAKRKKSLRFYTSQIVQKSAKRKDAGRDAGGDTDLPHRERLRDRQARLNAEAEKRGKKLDSYARGKGRDTDLGGDEDGDEEVDGGGEVREYGEDDEYYDVVAQRSQNRKMEKEENIAAAAEEKKMRSTGRYEEDAEGKRAIGYTIEKNKGLAPKRKKEVRNPRVKKRMKFEEKKKKLGSMKAVYKGGEGRGGYGGEKTGIKSNLVKSVKL